MQTLFPFAYPFPTAFYLTLYLSTWVVHVVFMHYVLAGSAYLAATSVIGGRAAESNPLSDLLRDWMPFMLSAAITAGVAPLLFLQILFPKHFYTANLLLFHRWMAILPVLIAGFYLLYLLKSKMAGDWPIALRTVIGCGAMAAFLFIGWSWTENHLLSLDEPAWPTQYVSTAILFHSPQLLPRLALWFTFAFPTMALMVGWQLWYPHRSEMTGPSVEPDSNDPERSSARIPGTRRASLLALGGLAASGLCAILYYRVLSLPAQIAVTAGSTLPYLIAAAAGMTLQAAVWIRHYQRAELTRGSLSLASAGAVLTLTGIAVIREAIRLSAIDVSALYEQHAHAAQIAGFWLFAAFLIVNAGLIVWSIRLVRQDDASPNI